MPLQLPEGFGHFEEWRPIAQSARLALNNCQIVPPVIDRLPRLLVRTVDNPVVLAQDLPLGRDDQPIRIDPQAHWPVRKGCRNAIAIALERDQAGRRHALGMFDKAIEGPPHRHQADNLNGVHIGNCAGEDAMLDFSPLCDAPLFQPGIEGIKIWEVGHWLP